MDQNKNKVEVPAEDRDKWAQFNLMCKQNKRFLIMIADPESDFIMMSHNGKRVFVKSQPNMIKYTLMRSRFTSYIVGFIGQVREMLDIKIIKPDSRFGKAIQNFFSFLDGSLFNISGQSKRLESILTTPKYDIMTGKAEKPKVVT